MCRQKCYLNGSTSKSRSSEGALVELAALRWRPDHFVVLTTRSERLAGRVSRGKSMLADLSVSHLFCTRSSTGQLSDERNESERTSRVLLSRTWSGRRLRRAGRRVDADGCGSGSRGDKNTSTCKRRTGARIFEPLLSRAYMCT